MLKRLTPVVALATGACFATRSDVQILQNDLRVLQAEQAGARAAADSAQRAAARRDSITGAQLDQLLGALRIIRDSATATNVRLQRFQGEVREDLYGLGQQLLQIQTLTGASEQRLRQFRLDMEQRSKEIQAANAADTASQSAAAAPGPEQLYDVGLQQARRSAWTSARSAFDDLLRQYPQSAVASDAQLQVAYTYEGEKNQAAADSVYRLVVATYPRSTAAPTALYKHAQSLIAARKTVEARALIDRLRRDYPGSDAERLSRDLVPPPGR
jgi:TolA-binding protein